MKTYTHKGWFGFCPIYLRNTFTDNPHICPRAKWLMPVMRFNIVLQQLAIGACMMVNSDWVPVWKIRLTGER